MPPDIVDPSSVFNPGAVSGTARPTCCCASRPGAGAPSPFPRSGDGFTFNAGQAPGGIFRARTTGRSETGVDLTIHHIYDPRITALDDQVVVVTAVDTDQGCRLAVWRAGGNPAGRIRGSGQAGADRVHRRPGHPQRGAVSRKNRRPLPDARPPQRPPHRRRTADRAGHRPVRFRGSGTLGRSRPGHDGPAPFLGRTDRLGAARR